MTHYGKKSRQRLALAHVDMQRIFSVVDRDYPHGILETERSVERQRQNVARGVSKTMNSKHLKRPTMAVDAAPDPLSWPDKNSPTIIKDTARYYLFAGFVLGVARRLYREGRITHRLRWGGDWDGDWDIHDQNFDDLVHFELVED